MNAKRARQISSNLALAPSRVGVPVYTRAALFSWLCRRALESPVGVWLVPGGHACWESLKPKGAKDLVSQSTQQAAKGSWGRKCSSFRYLIRRNPPMVLRVAYRRVVCLVACGLLTKFLQSPVCRDEYEMSVVGFKRITNLKLA